MAVIRWTRYLCWGLRRWGGVQWWGWWWGPQRKSQKRRRESQRLNCLIKLITWERKRIQVSLSEKMRYGGSFAKDPANLRLNCTVSAKIRCVILLLSFTFVFVYNLYDKTPKSPPLLVLKTLLVSVWTWLKSSVVGGEQKRWGRTNREVYKINLNTIFLSSLYFIVLFYTSW